MTEPILVKSPLGIGTVALLSIVYSLQRHCDIEGEGVRGYEGREGVWGKGGLHSPMDNDLSIGEEKDSTFVMHINLSTEH